MNDTNESKDLIDYDCISKSRLIRQICEIDDISINPKAFDRIMCTIQNQVPYNQVDYRDK